MLLHSVFCFPLFLFLQFVFVRGCRQNLISYKFSFSTPEPLFSGIWNGQNLTEDLFNMAAITSHCLWLAGFKGHFFCAVTLLISLAFSIYLWSRNLLQFVEFPSNEKARKKHLGSPGRWQCRRIHFVQFIFDISCCKQLLWVVQHRTHLFLTQGLLSSMKHMFLLMLPWKVSRMFCHGAVVCVLCEVECTACGHGQHERIESSVTPYGNNDRPESGVLYFLWLDVHISQSALAISEMLPFIQPLAQKHLGSQQEHQSSIVHSFFGEGIWWKVE